MTNLLESLTGMSFMATAGAIVLKWLGIISLDWVVLPGLIMCSFLALLVMFEA